MEYNYTIHFTFRNFFRKRVDEKKIKKGWENEK
jgi:hypothetical protein